MKEEICVFVPGVWLTEVRDENPVDQVCETSQFKLDIGPGLCRKLMDNKSVWIPKASEFQRACRSYSDWQLNEGF